MKNSKSIRVFSLEFKKEKVALIEQGKLSVSDVCKTYEVSQTAVRKWLKKFGSLKPTERIVVEKTSEQAKNVELLKQIAELERVIGKQQMQLIYKDALIQSINKEIGVDIEKKFKTQQ